MCASSSQSIPPRIDGQYATNTAANSSNASQTGGVWRTAGMLFLSSATDNIRPGK